MLNYNLMNPNQMNLDSSNIIQPQAQPYNLIQPQDLTYDASIVQPNSMPANNGMKLDYQDASSAGGSGVAMAEKGMAAALNEYGKQKAESQARENAARAKIFQDATSGGVGKVGNLNNLSLINAMPSDEKIKEFMDALKAYEYNYKGDEDKSRYQGVMAQDMEKSDVGSPLVMEVGGIKHIDMEKSLPVIEQSLGNLFERLKKLEGGKDGGK